MRDGEVVGARLFVGNLSFSLGDGDLREAFAEIGAVERAEIVRDRFDGRSRGFGLSRWPMRMGLRSRCGR